MLGMCSMMSAMTTKAPRRYCLVGCGNRGLAMFGKPLMNDFPGVSELAGIMDAEPQRLEEAKRILGADLPTFTDFDRMLESLRPDGICVATVDSAHADFVIRGLRAGLRVYCEKPLCVSEQECRLIASVAANAQSKCYVTHNARYNPARKAMCEAIRAGKIGQIQHVDFTETLDLSHGADYFRRWHKHKANSGGLMIHKASHHFDFINWVVGSLPSKLRAVGGTYFYGPAGPFHGERCSNCNHASECRFFKHLENPEASSHRKYPPDSCVFDPSIDTEDYACVMYEYQNGVRVNYNLAAYSSIEGNTVKIQGTEGRIEFQYYYMKRASEADGRGILNSKTSAFRLTLYNFLTGKAEELPFPEPKAGEHGGADPALRQHLFGPDWQEQHPEGIAPLEEAVQAVLVGAAANRSIALGGEEVDVQGLLRSDS